MGEFSLAHLLLLGAVVVILFGGKGRISSIMGDIGKGVGAFKRGWRTTRPRPRRRPNRSAPSLERRNRRASNAPEAGPHASVAPAQL